MKALVVLFCAAAMAAGALVKAAPSEAMPQRAPVTAESAAAKSCKPIKRKLKAAKRKLRRAESAAQRRKLRKRTRMLRRKLVKCRRPPAPLPQPSPAPAPLPPPAPAPGPGPAPDPGPRPGPAPGDTTAPAGPTLAFGELLGAGAAGGTVWLRRGAAGAFTVTATAADAESGIRHVTFAALGQGWTGGGDVTAAPYRMRYRFTAAAAAETVRVTATNGAGVTSAPAAFDVRRDEHLPQTAISCDGAPCGDDPANGPVTVRLTASDAGAGVDRIVYTLDGSAPTLATGTRYAGPFQVRHATDLRYRAYDRAGNEEALRTRHVAIAPPPDTLDVPSADPALPSNVGSATEFLYKGPGAVQTGVAEGTIEPWRAAALRGRVLDAQGAPVEGVRVAILDRPELGSTLTRAGGRYDLAVNGGGSVVLDYERDGYIDVQRTVEVPWQDYVQVDDVVLLGYDPKVTEIDLGSPEPIQTARGTVKADLDGARQATVMFREGTNARMTLPDGSEQELDTLSFRATEYTVGSRGAERMPAALPPTSAYTYAVELSADEAVAADATGVTFDKPVAFYLENFLDFNVGSAVPVGWYDRERGVWVPEPNGRVVEIAGETGGRADVNLDRDPGADPDRYAEFGLTDAERAELAQLYRPGQSLWRVQLRHFSPIDCNWLGRLGRPEGNGGPNGPQPGPNGPDPDRDDPDPDQDCKRSGSIIGCENRTLGEMVAVQGTPFALHYESDRVPGREADRALRIPITTEDVPTGMKRIEVGVMAAGQFTKRTFAPAPHLSWDYVWDGRDGFGRPVSGPAPVRVTIDFVYPAYRQQQLDEALEGALLRRSELNFFARMISPKLYAELDVGLDNWIARNRELTRVEHSVGKSWTSTVGSDGEGRIGTWDARGAGLGGWTLDKHHTYDPATRMIHLGDGDRVSGAGVRQVLQRVAGTGRCDFGGDGGPATEAGLCDPDVVAAGIDGSFYVSDGNVLRRVDPKGTIDRFAGSGICGDVPDGTDRLAADLCTILDVEPAPDGGLYVAQFQGVLRIAPDGTMTTIAGGGEVFEPEGRATEVAFCQVQGLGAGRDGGVYVIDGGADVVRYVGPDGMISTVAGTNPEDGCPNPELQRGAAAEDEEPETAADLAVGPDVAEGPDGSIYLANGRRDRLYRVWPDGALTHVAGRDEDADPPAKDEDGIPAVDALIDTSGEVTVGPDGAVYFGERLNCCQTRLRKVTADGLIETVAGVPPGAEGSEQESEGKIATSEQQLDTNDFALAPDGSFYLADGEHKVLEVTSPLPGGLAGRPVSVPSGDGSEVFQFTPEGRHLRTRDALTGKLRYEFGYDGKGRLVTVTDRNGNVTTIERDGATPVAIVAPGGQRTELTLDGNGYLDAIGNPAQEAFRATYTASGLMKSFAEPAGHPTTFEYDERGRLRREEGPGGVKTLASTDIPGGSRVTLTSGLGRTETYELIELSDGTIERRQVGPSGAETEVVVEPDGTLRSTYPDGTTAELVGAPDPRWGMLAPAVGSLTVTTPDGRTKVTREQRTATFMSDDPIGGLATLTNRITVNGRESSRSYDAATRTLTQRSAEGRESSTTFDAVGRVERWEPGEGLDPVTLSYDDRGRVTSTVQGPRTETLEYDDRNRVTVRADALGKQTRYTYDDADRLDTVELPSGRTLDYDHDANGNRTHVKMPEGDTHVVGHTDDDLVDGYAPPGNPAYEWSYDEDRALKEMRLPSGRTVAPGYEAGTGRISGETTAEAEVAYTYADDTPRVDTIARTPAGGGTTEALDFSYDSDLVTGVAMSGSAPGAYTFAYDDELRLTSAKLVTGADTVTTGMGRDDDGLLTQLGPFAMVRDGTGAVDEIRDGALKAEFDQDTLGRTDLRRYSVGGAERYAADLVFDAAGRLETKTERVAGTERTYEYTYDDDGQLLEVSDASGPLERYVYDDNGNRTSRRIGEDPAQAAGYDDQDRLEQQGDVAYAIDADGFITSRGNDTFEYGSRGELLSATAGGTEVTYANDGMGRRIARTQGQSTTRYFYGDLGNPFQVTASRSASGVLTTYYYDDAGALFALQRGGQRFYVASDQVGTPRVVTSAAGTVVKTLTYDSFGVLTADSDPSFELPVGFAGGLADPATGLVRFGYRDYDPVAGRWTARDPVFYGGGQANLFAYVSNNPVTHRDPSGLWCIEATGYSGVGGGGKLCHDKDGTSLCLEVGFGLGGSVGLDSGPMELPGSEIEAELKAKCGPIGAGAKCKFDECGLSCKPRGEAGPYKMEPDKHGVKVMTTSGAKAVLEGTKCSLQGKLAGRVCRAWRNYG